jgi:glycosyltransferase involved in cell wall biosynthesis
MAASRLTGIPFSFSARAADIHPPDGSLPVKMRAAAFVRVNTAANQTYLTEIAPDCADKIHLVYNGMTLPNPPLRDDPPPAPPYRLLALGRFTPKKGFDVLLDACALLKRQGFPFHLTLAGSGGQAIRLKAKRARLGLAGQVSMPGSICHSEVSGLMNRHHAFIMPSIVADSGDRDGIPNVIIEALCHRMPVIATDAGGISEVIQDGKTGLLRPQRDPAALAEAIAGLFMNPTQAAAMATAGNKLVQALFDGENNTRQLAALFIGHAR